jgi:exopolysaccharide biosynthesis polyprenyl glycosylphosphotransferase
VKSAGRIPIVVGTVALSAFFASLHAWQLAPTPYSVVGTERFPWTVVFAGLVLVASYAVGLPDLPVTRFQAASAAAGAVVTGFVGVSLAQLVLGAPLLPRAVMGGIAASYVPWALICWHAEHDRLRRSTLRALFIGAEQEYAELLSELVNERIPVELVAGVTATDDDRRNAVAGDLRQRISDDEIDLVVLDMASLAHHGIVSAIADAHREGVRVRTVSLFAEEFLGKIPVADLERMSLLFDIGELHRVRYMRWKRVIDIAFGVAALVVLVPATVVVVVGNLVANQGPLLYRQMRVGKDGKEFEILKFRTMSRSEDSEGDWTLADDPRITPFGSLLRRSHLDELPQAWNVMRGDLSIVGPRPEQPRYVRTLSEKIPFYDTRHLIRPGLTGWAQVSYPYGSDEIGAREKLQYDLYYLRRQSPKLDVQILVRTLRTVVGRTGR